MRTPLWNQGPAKRRPTRRWAWAGSGWTLACRLIAVALGLVLFGFALFQGGLDYVRLIPAGLLILVGLIAPARWIEKIVDGFP
jgi:hypothetical protein